MLHDAAESPMSDRPPREVVLSASSAGLQVTSRGRGSPQRGRAVPRHWGSGPTLRPHCDRPSSQCSQRAGLTLLQPRNAGKGAARCARPRGSQRAEAFGVKERCTPAVARRVSPAHTPCTLTGLRRGRCRGT